MMKGLRLQIDKVIGENITKDVRDLFRIIKTEIDNTTIKDIRNLFRLMKKN